MESMLMLVLILLFGLFAGISGFMACFMPTHWNQLTEKISFADRWSEPNPNRQPLSLRLFMRVGQSIGGLAVCLVGFGFAYLAGSGIYHVLTGHAVHHIGPSGPMLRSNRPPVMIVFPALITVAGVLMAIFPAKALTVFERLWPAGRTVSPPFIPTSAMIVRIFGVVLAVFAITSLLK